MTRKKKKLPAAVLYATRSEMIDPINAGSVLAWAVTKTAYGHRSADVRLSDCSRSIGWSFSVDKEGLAKLDKVLDSFYELRSQMLLAKGKK